MFHSRSLLFIALAIYITMAEDTIQLADRLDEMANNIEQKEDPNSDVPFMRISNYYRKLATAVRNGQLNLEVRDIQQINTVMDTQQAYITRKRNDESHQDEQATLSYLSENVELYDGPAAWAPKTLLQYGMMLTGYKADGPANIDDITDSIRDTNLIQGLQKELGSLRGAFSVLGEAENLVLSVLQSTTMPNDLELREITDKIGQTDVRFIRQQIQDFMDRIVNEGTEDLEEGRKVFYYAANRLVALTLSYRHAKYLMAGMYGLNANYRNMANAKISDVSDMHDIDKRFFKLLDPNEATGTDFPKVTLFYNHDPLVTAYMQSLGLSPYSRDLPAHGGCYHLLLSNDRAIVNLPYDALKMDTSSAGGTPVMVLRADNGSAPIITMQSNTGGRYYIHLRSWAAYQHLEFSKFGKAEKFYIVSKRKTQCLESYDIFLRPSREDVTTENLVNGKGGSVYLDNYDEYYSRFRLQRYHGGC